LKKKGRKKKISHKRKVDLWLKLALTIVLTLLVILITYVILTQQDAPATSTKPNVPQDDISQIIAPLLAQNNSNIVFEPTFEDELPNPTRHAENKAQPITTPSQAQHKLALIIDDVGYDLKAMRRLLALPYTLTVAILPDSPYAAEAARLAHQHGLTVMLHMPMQTTNPKYQQNMEKFYLSTNMSKQAFTDTFEAALAKIPFVEGINNHMGSALTADAQSMAWLMELCDKHDLFFIDSRTSSTSVGAKYAEQANIRWNERDIFLDHSVQPKAIQHAWQSAMKCIQNSDHCIMLAHPHQETLNFLEHDAKALNPQSFVPIKSVLK